jgi:hypothetical protein
LDPLHKLATKKKKELETLIIKMDEKMRKKKKEKKMHVKEIMHGTNG